MKHILILTALLLAPLAADESTAHRSDAKYTVAVYYWLNFHRDAYHESKKGQAGRSREIVRDPRPKFAGHEVS